MLAKSGRKVLRARGRQPNSAARRAREEFAPGFRASLAHVLNRLHPEVITALDLERHGLTFERGSCAERRAVGRPASR